MNFLIPSLTGYLILIITNLNEIPAFAGTWWRISESNR